ncbi:hypothetical protein MP228_005136 [Amoeboaphelidium protococcarum]|nr:hypothetical protein MP228_005136 [Amoeboaphelidium protococcarum]
MSKQDSSLQASVQSSMESLEIANERKELAPQQQQASQSVDPWDVKGAVVDGVAQAIDYNKLISEFGSMAIDEGLLQRFRNAIKLVKERHGEQVPSADVSEIQLHHFLTRGIFFSHRDLSELLDRVEKDEPFYLYTGRGPSSESMHLGHMIPFLFCKWLQEVFKVPLVIQLTDDEKFLFKDLTLEQCHQYAMDNAKDIIAIGFDPALTFIFSNLNYMGGSFYRNTVRIQKCINTNQSKSAFGFDDSASIGKLAFVAVQAAPAFCSTFSHIFGDRTDVPCLIPCAIDQDPYFRLTRDVSKRLNHPKPALIHSKFFPSLLGSHSKMSASMAASTIYMTDTPSQVEKKIKKYAFSGGRETLEIHRQMGGDTEVDVSYQYMRFFLDDDAEVERIGALYRSGEWTSGEMKGRCSQVLSQFVTAFQERRLRVTDQVLAEFMDSTRKMTYIERFPAQVQQSNSLGKSSGKKLKKSKSKFKE